MTQSDVPRELRDEIPSFEEAPSTRPWPDRLDRPHIDPYRKSAARVRRDRCSRRGGLFRNGGAPPGHRHARVRLPEADLGRQGAVRHDFWLLYGHHLWVTLQEFLLGFAIGSTIGLVLAAVITQKPFVEKIVAPYIIILVVTPMLALVPFLRIGLIKSFSIWPIVVAVALASGPMVLINAATGFRRPTWRRSPWRARTGQALPDLPPDPVSARAPDDHRRLHGRIDLRLADSDRR